MNNIRFRQLFVERNKNAVAAKRRNICRYPIVGVLSDTGNMSFIIGDFVEKCAEALSDTQPERVRARIEEGRKSSWDARVEQMCEILRSEKIL